MLKNFKAVYKKGNGGLKKISLVEFPAIEENFITLSKEKEVLFVLSNQERREILTPILIPNKPIFRKAMDNIAEDFYMSFDEATIKDISYDVIANKDLLFNDEHTSTILEGIEIQQVFLSDIEKGIQPIQFNHLPDGTLYAVLKVNNEDVWNDVLNGTFKGVSVEVSVALEEVEEDNQLKRVVGLLFELLNGNN